jgi:hypothetical protein
MAGMQRYRAEKLLATDLAKETAKEEMVMNSRAFDLYKGIMTEAAWLTAKESWMLLTFLEGYFEEGTINALKMKPSDRKWRMFACATVRSIANGIDNDLCRKCLEIAEQFADGLVDVGILQQFQHAAEEQTWPDQWQGIPAPYTANFIAGRAGITQKGRDCYAMARWVSGMVWQVIMATEEVHWENFETLRAKREEYECELIRCIFGNPFHPITLDSAWLTPKVKLLAKANYDDRAFERMPELADALEQGGCTNQDILNHCRGLGPHVKGCWALDLLLGKE